MMNVVKIFSRQSSTSTTYTLNFVLLLKALLLMLFISSQYIGLGPDEAQYWSWSQALDWGYYSKPPAIAWQIWLGTKLFGNSELGVRFFSIVLSYGLSLTIYAIALASQLSPTIAFWAAISFAFSPLGFLSSLLAITDGGISLAWALATLMMVYALQKDRAPNYIAIGIILFFGALFKWPIYLFWLFVCLFITLYRFLYRPQLFIGILISFLGLLPSIYWNSKHNWVTFRHVFSTIYTPTVSKQVSQAASQGNFFDFIGSQMVLFSPVLFVLALFAFIFLMRGLKSISPALKFCALPAFILLMLFSFIAIFKKLQGNWSDFAYPPLFVFLAWYCIEKLPVGKFWLKMGTGVSILLMILILSVPAIQKNSLLPIPYKINPFKHNLGWNHLSTHLKNLGFHQDNFLFADKYQTASILSFYSPAQKRAYFFNLHAIRKNQFSFWPGLPEEQRGQTGFFIATENFSNPSKREAFENQISSYKKKLSLYFEYVEFMGLFPLFESNGEIAKAALIFKCFVYNGKEPPEVDLY